MESLCDRIDRVLRSAVDSDKWGQVIEAGAGYAKAASMIEKDLQGLGTAGGSFLRRLSDDALEMLFRFWACVKTRNAVLASSRGHIPSVLPTKQQMESLYGYLIRLPGSSVPTFPIDVSQLENIAELRNQFPIVASSGSSAAGGGANGAAVRGSSAALSRQGDGTTGPGAAGSASAAAVALLNSNATGATTAGGGSLLPQPPPQRGVQYLAVTIDSIGLKDAITYKRPYISVSLVDAAGNSLEQTQDTPYSIRLRPLFVDFRTTVFLQTPLAAIPKDACLFFEFKHFKEGKGKISTRCFSFAEILELSFRKSMALELYKKPTDFTRKKTSLFTEKKLFLNIQCELLKF